MKKVMLWSAIFAATALMAVTTPAPPSASAGTPVTVRLPSCVLGTQARTVPAGSDVTIAAGLSTRPRAGIEQFLSAVSVTAEVDGTLIANANDYFTPAIHHLFTRGSWGTDWRYALPTLEHAGDQVVIEYRWDVSDRFLSVDAPILAVEGPPFVGPGELLSGSCTITAS